MKQSKRSKKIRRLVATVFLCTLMLAVSAYAWFIGMKTVNVSPFDIDIASTEGLFLSMDGENWSYTLDARNATPYTANTNTWAPEGLIPMSSIGDVDATASRMVLFEKGSLTATKGGYRLLASRVHNYDVAAGEGKLGTAEAKGYVAFDLFIKNISGNAYYDGLDLLNEEAIYLTTNSKVTVSSSGEAGTGIENSVRVAFIQLGRVQSNDSTLPNESTATTERITSITCADDSTANQAKITGICRNAQIWEPNDTKHVQNAINWYDTSCKKRVDADVTLASSYDTTTACKTVADGTTVPTYAIANELTVGANVDVYDGTRFNYYTDTTISYDDSRNVEGAAAAKTAKKQGMAVSSAKLVDFPYFTDTMKLKEGTERPTFMTLAPNSITKLRVYIYIEGQDIDNYDFAQLGKSISINFGFTKERYIESDVNYDNVTPLPATNPSDNATIPNQHKNTTPQSGE